jgi:hypothetical protein
LVGAVEAPVAGVVVAAGVAVVPAGAVVVVPGVRLDPAEASVLPAGGAKKTDAVSVPAIALGGAV